MDGTAGPAAGRNVAGVPSVAASCVVLPDRVLDDAVVETDGSRIVAVRPASGPVPDRILCPGFVDLQVNGSEDVDVATADGPDWSRLDSLLLAQGVTAWCPTLVTAPLASLEAALARIADAAARPAAAGRPLIAGAHLEGPFLGGAPGAHRREHLRDPDLDWLARLPSLVRVVTLAPERPRALEAVDLLARRGVLVSLGHSTATHDQARAAVDAGARLVTHLFNGMAPLHHRDPGLAGLALADDRLAVSLIADGVHLHPSVLKAAAAAKGRGRTVLVTDAVAWAAPDRSSRIAVGGVPPAPRLPDGTLAGSALTMDAAVRLCVAAGLPVLDAVHAATTAPASLLGLGDRGRIEAGARADLVLLGPGLHLEDVLLAAA